jgi:hypothetical protein
LARGPAGTLMSIHDRHQMLSLSCIVQGSALITECSCKAINTT